MLFRPTHIFTVLLVLLACCATAQAASGRLDGAAQWRYGEYEAEENGTTVADGDFFSQQYSLFYSRSGLIKDGRGGKYDLGLGYEWTGVNSRVNDNLSDRHLDADFETGKVLYQGDLELAPGGLPFRLTLYSHDLHRTSLEENNIITQGSDFSTERERNLLSANIVDDLTNGTHISSGGTLMLGIRNGSYLGRYRNTLSQLPRLFVDYQEEYVRDVKTLTPTHFRDRNLAFVSLNKKDNWFHYRLRDYRDYVNEEQNYTEKVYMLGTVDHHLIRQWINLTNWIQVSADGALTETHYEFNTRPNTDQFDVNLFAKAVRNNWQASNFTSLGREVEDRGRLRKTLDIPFYANGEFDRNTAWRFTLLTEREQIDTDRIDPVLNRHTDEDDVYLKTRFETFRQARFIAAPSVELEAKTGDRGEGNAARAQLEYYSNRSYNPRYDLFGSYAAMVLSGQSVSGTDVDYWENVATGRISTYLNRQLMVGGEERLLYGDGDLNDESVTTHITPLGSMSLAFSDETNVARNGQLLRSTTTLFAEHTTSWRLKNRLELMYDTLSDDNGNEYQVSLTHRLRYDGRQFNLNMTNRYVSGDNVVGGGSNTSLIDTRNLRQTIDSSYSHQTTLRYSPGRLWELKGFFSYDWWEEADGNSNELLQLKQTYVYNLFKVNGIVRKYADLIEEIEWEKVDSAGVQEEVQALTLGCNLYPTRTTLLGVKSKYRRFEPQNEDDLLYMLVAGLNFEKLKVTLDYGYGVRNGSTGSVDSLPDRKEHRWQVNVEKIF